MRSVSFRAKGQKLVGKLARGGDIIEASANNAAESMPVAVRAKTENLQVKSRGFSFRRHPRANPTNFRGAHDAYLKQRARRIMRQRSFQLMRSEIFLHAADVSSNRETDARVPQTKVGHRSRRASEKNGQRTADNGWEYASITSIRLAKALLFPSS